MNPFVIKDKDNASSSDPESYNRIEDQGFSQFKSKLCAGVKEEISETDAHTTRRSLVSKSSQGIGHRSSQWTTVDHETNQLDESQDFRGK